MTIYQKHVEFRCIECVHGHILGTPFTYIQKKIKTKVNFTDFYISRDKT